MNPLPLYPAAPTYPVQTVRGHAPDPSCTRCGLHRGAKFACVGHQLVQDGEGPPILLLLPGLLAADDGAPLNRDSGRSRFLRSLLPAGRKVIAATATRCGSATAPTLKDMQACLGFTVHTWRHEAPARVLVFGQDTAEALLGDAPPPDSARRGYVFVSDVPVFLLEDPAGALKNRFNAQALAFDVKHAFGADVRPPPLGGSFFEVNTVDEAREAARVLLRADGFTWDCETFGRAYDKGFRILCVACTPRGSDSPYVWTEKALADPAARTVLIDLLEDPDVEKAGQNIMFDLLAVNAAWGATPRTSGRCTQLRRSMLDSEALTRLEVQQALVGMFGGKADMKAAVQGAAARITAAAGRVLTQSNPLFDDREDALLRGVDAAHARDNPKSYAYALVPRDLLHRYCAQDAVSTDRLDVRHDATLRLPPLAGMRRLWDEVVSGASEAVAQVSAWGVLLSRDALMSLRAYLNIAVGERAKRLALAGVTDPGSADHVAEVLYDKLKLPARYGTTGGKRSTASEALEEIQHLHPAVGDMLEWRRLDKLRGTYAEGLLKQMTPDGRIHVDFRIDGARTGRMSAGGGLHGLPRPEDDEARMVRDCIVAPPDHTLVELDLSQAELRVLAGLSGDPVMGDTFVRGVDIHTRTAHGIARRVWNIDPAQVQSKHRSVAKIINLSLAYGRGDAALAAEITAKSGKLCTREEAGEVKQAILGEFGVASSWMDGELEFGRKHGFAHTYWQNDAGLWVPARRRLLWHIGTQGDTDEGRRLRGKGDRAAKNTPVQGTTSDVVLACLIETVDWIRRSGVRAKLVLTVHDSLLLEVHNADVAKVIDAVRAIMQRRSVGKVPLIADVKLGPSAGSLEKPK